MLKLRNATKAMAYRGCKSLNLMGHPNHIMST